MDIVRKKDAVYVLNHCTRSLARDNQDQRHNYGQYSEDDTRSSVAEAWRFPIIDSYRDPSTGGGQEFNLVTFVCINRAGAYDNVAVIGSFSDLVNPIPLEQVDTSHYWAVSVLVPKSQTHYYKFLTGPRAFVDPINPQRITRPDGSEWSSFFTEYCTDFQVLEGWEAKLLERLTNHILPFRTTEAQRFLNYYYQSLDKKAKENLFGRVYRLDQPVGAANFIDKILARQERHRLIDYQICLELCYQVLQRWAPDQDPLTLSVEAYASLYQQMAEGSRGSLAGWDYSRYESPRFFLQLLRRHTFTGAFSHPKHGGNSGAAGWQFLATNLINPITNELPKLESINAPGAYFDWARAHEPPLGRNTEYNG